MGQSRKKESAVQEKSSEQKNKKLFHPSLCLKPDLIEKMLEEFEKERDKEKTKKTKKPFPHGYVWIDENGGWTCIG